MPTQIHNMILKNRVLDDIKDEDCETAFPLINCFKVKMDNGQWTKGKCNTCGLSHFRTNIENSITNVNFFNYTRAMSMKFSRSGLTFAHWASSRPFFKSPFTYYLSLKNLLQRCKGNFGPW